MTNKSSTAAPSERTRLRRYHWLARYDKDTINEIIDAAMICHVGYIFDGHPYVTPTNHWRIGEYVYWHGSSASRMLKAQAKGIPVCFSVTHLDGLVISRAAFNHNVNFRSVMAFGNAELVEEEEKKRVLSVFVNKLVPGLWEHARQPTASEWKATRVIKLRLDEVSAKVRNGPPVDDEADYQLDCWAGIIPIKTVTLPPEADPKLNARIKQPEFINKFKL